MKYTKNIEVIGFCRNNLEAYKGPLILLCQIISVECLTNLNFPLLTSNQNKGRPKQPISMKRRSKFVGHSTEIISQSKIKGSLKILEPFFDCKQSFETLGNIFHLKYNIFDKNVQCLVCFV